MQCSFNFSIKVYHKNDSFVSYNFCEIFCFLKNMRQKPCNIIPHPKNSKANAKATI